MAKLILSPAPCTVRHSTTRKGWWIVEGETAVVAGELACKPFVTHHKLKSCALAEAARRDQLNAEAIADLEAETVAEKARVAERRDARAAAKAYRADKKTRQYAFPF